MDTFEPSKYLVAAVSDAKERFSPVWQSAATRLAPVWRWLMLRRRAVFWAAGISLAVVLLIGFVIGGGASWYARNSAALAPLLTLVAGISVAAVALIRHFAQTDADRQRRITESFSKAVEQLGSDKLEVRLGAGFTRSSGFRRKARMTTGSSWRT